MAHEHRWRGRVAFSETDMAGIVHFSNYFRYFENAEHAFWRHLGLRVHDDVGFARVHASCDYMSPLRYEDEYEVHVEVETLRPRSIRYRGSVRRVGGDVVAKASWVVVCVRMGAGGMESTAIPDAVLAVLEAAPDERPDEKVECDDA